MVVFFVFVFVAAPRGDSLACLMIRLSNDQRSNVSELSKFFLVAEKFQIGPIRCIFFIGRIRR